MTNQNDPDQTKKELLKLAGQKKIRRVFYIGIFLMLTGVIIGMQEPEPEAIILRVIKLTSLLTVLEQFLIGSGSALIISGTFSIIIGTQSFLSFIEDKILNKMSTPEFVERLGDGEQRKLAKKLFAPPVEISSIFKPTERYFDYYIQKGRELFDHPFRSDLKADIEAYMDSEKNCVVVKTVVKYRTYKFKGKHKAFQGGLEDENSVFDNVVFRSDDPDIDDINEKFTTVERTDERLMESIKNDPTIKKFGICEVPQKLKDIDTFIIERTSLEYGSDHWKHYLYRANSPIYTLDLNFTCKDGLIVKDLIVFANGSKYSISNVPEERVSIACPGWVEPGFGISSIIALDETKQ